MYYKLNLTILYLQTIVIIIIRETRDRMKMIFNDFIQISEFFYLITIYDT